MEDVNCHWIAVSLVSNIFKRLACLGFSNSCWLLNNFEQPDRFTTSRELRPNMLLGTLTRFLQFFKFNAASFLRRPIEELIRTRFEHPARFSHSRFGAPLKSGVLIRFLDCVRTNHLKLGRGCNEGARGANKINHHI